MARKYQVLLDHLRLMSGGLPNGTALPSVRDLIREFRVSQSTVDRALAFAKAEGFVEVKPGEGVFALHRKTTFSAEDSLRIIFALHDYPSSFTAKMEKELSRAFVAVGHSVNVFRFSWNRRLPAVFKPGLDDAIVFLPPTQTVDPADIVTLRKTGLPMVSIASVCEGMEIDTVGMDNMKIGEMAAAILAERGCRDLCVLVGEPMGPQIQARLTGFAQACTRAGLPKPLILDAKTAYGESSLQKSYERTLAFPRAEARVDGLFAVSDACALGAIRALHERGVKVPGNILVLGCDDVPEASYLVPSLSSLGHDYSRWAAEILAILQRRRAGDTAAAMHVGMPSIFIERESTGPRQPIARKTRSAAATLTPKMERARELVNA
jgi:DNA-binding LacI/PurR family transcriptional regulator